MGDSPLPGVLTRPRGHAGHRARRLVRGDWYVTGDRAYRDDDGYLWFVGRADDVIISAGYTQPARSTSARAAHD